MEREDLDKVDAASALEQHDLFLKLTDWYEADLQHWSEWRQEAKRCYAFRDGDQWSKEDKAHLEKQGRPCITFNRTLAIIKAVCGIEINGRHETVFLPRGMMPGTIKANELLSSTSQWMSDNCDAEDHQSAAFQDLVTCGMGWTEGRISFEDDPEGAYVEERIDPFEMLSDRAARGKNLADARRLWRVKKMSFAEARDLFPDAEEEDLDAAWAETGDTGQVVPIEERRKKRSESSGNGKGSEVRIVHAQWIEKEPYYRIADPTTGQIHEMTAEQFEPMREQAQAAGVTFVKQTRKVYKQAFLGGKMLTPAQPGPSKTGFSWTCMTGEPDRNKGVFYGLVRLMLDPQMWANKWLSQTLHILNTTAKGGIIAEEDAFSDQREAEMNYAQPDAITWARKGAVAAGKIMQKPGTGISNGYVNLLEFAISSIRDATGINLELLGMRDANQAGVLEAQRKQAAMTILATLFDSLRRFRKINGRLRLYYIQEFLADDRLIRVTGNDGDMQVMPLIKDQVAGDYEVIVDDAPTSPNAKEQTWATIQQVLPAFRDLLSPEAVIAILEYSPLPSKLVDAFKAMAEQAKAPTPEKEQEKQLMIEGARAKIDKDASSAEATRAKGLLDLAQLGVVLTQQEAAHAASQMMSPQPWQPMPDGMAIEPMAGPTPPMPPQLPQQQMQPQLPMPMPGE